MANNDYKILGIVRGGFYAKRDPRPSVVRECAQEAQEKLARLLLGKRKSRQLRSVQAGITKPLGEPMKLAAELQDARIGFEQNMRIVIVPQIKAVARMYGHQFDTGEFDPPTAPAAQAKAA
jgi:hypothetical protein